jgi:hypothetical protein
MKKLTVLLILVNWSLLGQIPTVGLVGAWTFSGNANDVSGNGNHGTVSGASLTADRCGNSNSAYSFNGTTDNIVMLTAGPTGSVSRSVSFWAATTNTNLMCLFAYGGTTAGKALAFQYNYNCQGVGIDVNNQAITRGNSCILNGKWHHVVAVIDTSIGVQISNVQFYIDGIAMPAVTCFVTGSVQTISTGTNFPITIGKIHDAPTRYFKGELDDFYLYNRALSPSEVQQLYTACSPAILGNTLICAGSTNVYTLGSSSGSTLNSWSLPSGWTGSSTSNTISVTSNSVSGILSVTTPSGSCGGLGTSASLTVNVNSVPTLSVSGKTQICYGQNATLTVSGALSYTWQPGSLSSNSISVSSLSTTVYTITGINSSSCVSVRTHTLNVNPCNGIGDEDNNLIDCKVFSNPGSGQILILMSSDAEVTITNGSGKLIYKSTLVIGENILNLKEEPAGVFFIRILANGNSCNIKYIKILH